MSKLLTAQDIPLPIPSAGMNRRDPLLGMSQNYSPWLLNVDCENQFNRVRNGVVIHSTLQDVAVINNLGVYGSRGYSTNKLFAYSQVVENTGPNKVYDVTASAESLVATRSTGAQADEIHPFNFNQRLMFHGEANFADDDLLYDGSSWSTSGFEYPAATPIGGRAAGSYKGRPYFANANYLYYPTTVGAVTGTLNIKDFSSVFNFSGNIAFIATISAPGDRPTDMFFVMGNTNGQILVYGGDYPDSSTWSLVSQFQTSALLGYNAIITYNNDILILTRTGIVSLRQLFIEGNKAAETLNISDPIDDYWIKLINNRSATFHWAFPSAISGCYWPEKNRILILVPGHVDIDGVYSASYATMFSYNCATKAWSIYKLANVDATWIGGMTYFAGSVYFFTRNVVMTISSTVFKDETYNSAGSYSAYAHAQHSAYINVDSLSKGKRVQAIEPIIKTDFSGATDLGVKVASDAGRSVSQATYPTLADGYNSPYCSVGVEGTYLQYRLEGTTDVASTDGLELYAVTAILEGQGVR